MRNRLAASTRLLQRVPQTRSPTQTLLHHSTFLQSSQLHHPVGAPSAASAPAAAAHSRSVGSSSTRSISSTTLLSKKGGSKNKSAPPPVEGPALKGGASAPDADDPYDVAALESGIAHAQERLREDLSKLRAGGRFNPEVVEDLRVTLDKAAKQTVRLGDVAQVVPRGRVLSVMVGENEVSVPELLHRADSRARPIMLMSAFPSQHLKAVSSAIQGSPLSLTPQPDVQNPLQLNVPLPPPTAESRREAVKQATAAADNASTMIRNARGAQQKRLNAMKVSRSARPDDLKKASDRMEKVVERGAAEVKKIVDAAKKVLEGG